MSISRLRGALTRVSASGIHTHSTRSRSTTLPPARPDIGSVRGLYFVFLTKTSFAPGFHSSFLKMKGPEPIELSICWKGSVSATRLGIMKGTVVEGLPIASNRGPNFSLSTISKVFGSTALYSATRAASFCPMASRADQRLSEAMQSSAVTGVPSCHCRPSRSVKVQTSPSSLVFQVSTICGFTWNLASTANSVS